MTKTSRKIANDIVNWVGEQTYGNENILHAAVCCDHVGRSRFIKKIAEIIVSGSESPDTKIRANCAILGETCVDCEEDCPEGGC